MKSILILVLSLGITLPAFSDNAKLDSIKREMHAVRKAMLQKQSQETLLEKNEQFKAAIEAFLNVKGSYKEATDSLSYFGDLYSPDNTFRILTWNVPLPEGRFNYYCYLQTNDERWYELEDGKHTGRRLENKTFSHTEWLGALYFEILPVKQKKETYYFLMGWDGFSNMSNRKILETMYFDSRGFPKFGKSVLKGERFTKRRMILQYTEDAYVSLRYHPQKKMIVYSHLEPLREELQGVYEFYAPDLSYDGYKQKGKFWQLVEDVDVREEKNDKSYKDPRKDKGVPVKPDKP